MEIKIIKKKASSLKNISYEAMECEPVETLKELLVQMTIYEYKKQMTQKKEILSQKEIESESKFGKITFGNLYNENEKDIGDLINVMLQDYQDGLFRVFWNQEECLDLNQKLDIQEENEVVFIKLVMLAGRLW